MSVELECYSCEGKGEVYELGAPEPRLAGPFACHDCNGSGFISAAPAVTSNDYECAGCYDSGCRRCLGVNLDD